MGPNQSRRAQWARAKWPIDYNPALGFHWLTPFYDPLRHWLLREEQFKGHLIEEASIQAGHHVLDFGCGTGTLTVVIKQLRPAAEGTGLDVDAQVLQIARASVSTGSSSSDRLSSS